MSKTRTLNRTIATVLTLLLSVSMLSVINLTLPVYATIAVTNMSPTSGPVGTTITFNGTIDTFAGGYTIYFDSDGSGKGEADESVATGTATGTTVDTTFAVPDSINASRTIWLHDNVSGNNATAAFTVGTNYCIAVTPSIGQEDYTNFTITANVTGGTAADIGIQINVTKPDGTSNLFNMTLTTNNDWGNATTSMNSQTAITFDRLTTNASKNTNYRANFTYAPAVDGSETIWGNVTAAGANATLTCGRNRLNYTCTYNATHGFRGINVTLASLGNNGVNATIWANYTYLNFTTPYCGTYTVSLNVTSQHSIATSDTFEILISNATTYNRGDTVDLRSTHWNFTTPQRLNFTITCGGTLWFSGQGWVNYTAPHRTANWTWTIPSSATLGTYTVTVTNMTAGLNKTALGVPDTSTFQVVGTGVLQFTNRTYPATSYMRTQTASWKFNVTYLGGGNFTAANASLTPVYVYRNGTQIASATVANYDGGYWNATWAISKSQTLGAGYYFNISANSWNDTLGNQGPASTWMSRNFTIILANLTATWYDSTLANYNASLTPDSWQNRTLWQNCTFRVTYPDNSVLTSSLASVLNITVWNSTHTIANLTYSAGNVTYSSGTGNWTVKWHIPYNLYNATDQSRYTFCLLANYTQDTYGNKGPMQAAQNSTQFKVTSAVITVASISRTQSSYARGTYVRVYFTGTYPDGSAVTNGNATIILTKPDATTTTIYATYSAGNSRFEATYYLDSTAQLGIWTANLTAHALNDTKGETPRWYPGNTGPATFRTTTFNVTESTTLMDILTEVQNIEAKLDNSTYGLVAIKDAIDQLQTTLNQIGTYVDSILTEVQNIEAKLDNSTYGLVAIKNAVDAIAAKLDEGGTFYTFVNTWFTTIEDKLILAPSEVKFDFGEETSLWEPEFIRVTPTTEYSSDLGYGWTNTTGLYSRDRDAPDYARRDFIFSSLDKTFKVDLPNGNYTVMVTIGDQSYAHDNMTIYAEGSLKATVGVISAGKFVQEVFHVTVSDGNLALTLKDIGGTDPNWLINALIIQRSWK